MHYKERLPFLDSLRGLAALYVLTVHVVLLQIPILQTPKLLTPFILNGTTGVTLFFIISGFTICYAYKARSMENKNLLKFYIRRAVRILPLYYALLLFCAVINWGIDSFQQHLKDFLIYGSLLFTFIPGKQQGFVPASWTLSIEVIFYILFPFIFPFVNTLRKSIVFFFFTFTLSDLYVRVHHSYFDGKNYEEYFTIFFQLPIFAMGIVLYFIHEKFQNTISAKLGYALLGIGVLGIFFLPYFKLQLYPVYCIAIFYSCTFLGLSLTPVKLLVNRATSLFGIISYSVYLIHSLVIVNLVPYYHHLTIITHNKGILFVLYTIFTLIPVVLLSTITYKTIEKKSNDLGRRIISKISRPNHSS